ncbi:ABC transporter ATP-binding protein [Paenibacillus sp. FSL H8-0537]|uniref:ABC transporter ATP-binding protein n=1 Tax=Paenibacillus sp. FSL H8-0537 TaxID=2921399 RepID=UPI00310130F0
MSLQLSNVNKVMNEKTIVSDLSLTVPKGKIIGFLGPNGAGKTTTLHMAAGLMKPTSGEILINGISIHENWKKAKSQVSIIADYPLLYDELSGMEYIKFSMELFELKMTDSQLAAEIERFRFTAEIAKRIKHYSLGNRKKLALLVALLKQPKILLLDEYISGLDPHNSILAREIFIDYAAKGGAVLLSTHQLEIAEKFCDEVILIKEGRLLDKSSLSEVLEQSDSLEQYYVSQIKT